MQYIIQATHHGVTVWWSGHDWTNNPIDARLYNTRGGAVVVANAVVNTDNPVAAVVAV